MKNHERGHTSTMMVLSIFAGVLLGAYVLNQELENKNSLLHKVVAEYTYKDTRTGMVMLSQNHPNRFARLVNRCDDQGPALPGSRCSIAQKVYSDFVE